MADLGEHQFGGGLDVERFESHAQRLGEPDRVALGAFTGREPGQCEREKSLRGRPSRSIARAATIRAWVESRPPDSPSTTFGYFSARSRCSRPDTWMLYTS